MFHRKKYLAEEKAILVERKCQYFEKEAHFKCGGPFAPDNTEGGNKRSAGNRKEASRRVRVRGDFIWQARAKKVVKQAPGGSTSNKKRPEGVNGKKRIQTERQVAGWQVKLSACG